MSLKPRKRPPLLLVLLLMLPHGAAGTERVIDKRATANLVFQGEVQVGHEPAITGLTLFAGSVMRTGAESAAILSMESSGQVQIYEETEVKWETDECGFLLRLTEGRVRVYVPAEVTSRVVTPDGEVTTGGAPAVFNVESDEAGVRVSPEVGEVQFLTGGSVTTLTSDDALPSVQDKPTNPPPVEGEEGKKKKKKKATIWGSIGAAAQGIGAAIITAGTSSGFLSATLPIIAVPSPSS